MKKSLNDLPPKIVVSKQRKQDRFDPVNIESDYSDENLRVMKLYNIGAEPWRGQWVIRVDLYE